MKVMVLSGCLVSYWSRERKRDFNLADKTVRVIFLRVVKGEVEASINSFEDSLKERGGERV